MNNKLLDTLAEIVSPEGMGAIEEYARSYAAERLQAVLNTSSGGGSWRRAILQEINRLKGQEGEK